jgi:hypothetical protein
MAISTVPTCIYRGGSKSQPEKLSQKSIFITRTAENILSTDLSSVAVIFTSFKALFDVVHIVLWFCIFKKYEEYHAEEVQVRVSTYYRKTERLQK